MRIIAGFLCILLIAGCSEKDSIPSGVIGKEEMGEILWDMMQADQYAAGYVVKDSASVNVKTETLKLYEEVFRLHKVSRDEFRKSFQFYQDHPDITRTLFDSLIARGNRQRAESYSHPSVTNPAPGTPVIRPPVTPTGTSPARTLLNRPGPTSVRPITGKDPTGRQRGRFLPGKDTAQHGRGVKFLPGKDSLRHGRGAGFLPGRLPQLLPGVRGH
jgi:hypothetical protein